MTESLKKYRGTYSLYTEIATRPDGTALGVAFNYEIHATTKTGYFITRFVARSNGPMAPFTRLSSRGGFDHFREVNEDGTPTGPVIKAIRLNKLAIPVFKAPVQPYELGMFGDSFNLWNMLALWVTEQAAADGFTVAMTPDELAVVIREQFIPVQTDPAAVELVLDFPDLTQQKPQSVQSQYQATPEDDADDDGDDEEDEDEEDGDEDESVN